MIFSMMIIVMIIPIKLQITTAIPIIENVMYNIFLIIVCIGISNKTILNLIVAFWEMLKDIFTGKFSFKNLNEHQRMIVMLFLGLLPLFLLFLPIPGSGTNIKGIAEELSSERNIILVGITLLLTSLLLRLGTKKQNLLLILLIS